MSQHLDNSILNPGFRLQKPFVWSSQWHQVQGILLFECNLDSCTDDCIHTSNLLVFTSLVPTLNVDPMHLWWSYGGKGNG